MTTAIPAIRLDKLLANLGYGSRRAVQDMARAGTVVLNGRPVSQLEDRVGLSADLPSRLQVAGAPLDPLPGFVVLLNKPLGMTCSHDEAGALVYDLLPKRWRLRSPPLSSIGRLDKETSGLLLLTDDGALLHKIIAPKAQLPKRYRVDLARPLRGDEAAIIAAGTLMLKGETKPLRPGHLQVDAPRRAHITITEGRYHQVRRMFAALGNHVEALHRDQLGGLALPDDLRSSHYRILDAPTIARVFGAMPIPPDLLNPNEDSTIHSTV